MSAALKLNMEAAQLSQKPPLGEKVAKPRLVWENPNLSYGTHKEKSEVSLRLVSGVRYVQSDPIGIKGGLNTYLYANASPYRYIDPRGQNAGVGVGVGIITFCRLYPSACIAAGYALCRALGGCDAPVISPIPYHNDSGEGDGGTCDTKGNEDAAGPYTPLPPGYFPESAPPPGGPNDPDKQDRKSKRKRKRDKKASEQYEEIEREQRRRRSQNDNTSIESIEKSRQRDRNSRKPWNIDYDDY